MNDWSSLIKDLEAKGFTLAQIGKRIGLAAGSVGDIKSGRSASPRGMAAVALYSLHKRECRGKTGAA